MLPGWSWSVLTDLQCSQSRLTLRPAAESHSQEASHLARLARQGTQEQVSGQDLLLQRTELRALPRTSLSLHAP